MASGQEPVNERGVEPQTADADAPTRPVTVSRAEPATGDGRAVGRTPPTRSLRRTSPDFDLIEAARMQAQHRSAPAFGALLAGGVPGYKVLREIHRGGQGVVYLAVQESTKRKVALKVMREGPFAGPHDRVRFEREVRVLAQLNNANIVTIHDSGSHAGCFYYVMDYIPGHVLDEYVKQASLAPREILRLFATICNAVNAAHLRGVIHRDLKPSNVRVSPDGIPHVLDFGLAKVSDNQSSVTSMPTQMTATGQFIGSLPWASPEQAGGDPAAVDVRTDVYSLGVMLYQLLTGRFPYTVEGPMRLVLDNIVTVEPPRPRTLNRQISGDAEAVVMKALAKAKEQRYQTAGEVARDLERCLAGEPVEARRTNRRYMLGKALRRYRGASLAALGVVGGGAIGLGLVAQSLSEAQRVNEELMKQLEAKPAVEDAVRMELERLRRERDEAAERAAPVSAEGGAGLGGGRE